MNDCISFQPRLFKSSDPPRVQMRRFEISSGWRVGCQIMRDFFVRRNERFNRRFRRLERRSGPHYLRPSNCSESSTQPNTRQRTPRSPIIGSVFSHNGSVPSSQSAELFHRSGQLSLKNSALKRDPPFQFSATLHEEKIIN